MSALISLSKSEKSYIQTALREPSPIRADGRSLLGYRSIALETGAASLANGSARVNIGKTAGEESGSGTEVIAAAKLEVENVLEGDGVDGGRVVCTVSWFVS
jgi:exosome complex component RRP42